MARSLPDLNRAISRARDLPYGSARNEVAATLVREVLADGPAQAQPYALFTLTESYIFSMQIEKAYLPFTQSVRLWDEHPELFDEQDVHSFFWSFKWMVGDLMQFPSIPAAQIEDTLADMERRYRLAGNGLSAVNHLIFQWQLMRGTADVERAYEAWVTTDRDDFSQCAACEPGDRTAYLFKVNRFEEGIRLLEAADETSSQCHSEPADRLSQLQLAYLEVGNLAGAASAHRKSLQHLGPDLVGARGAHIQFLARTGNTAAALRFLNANQSLLTTTETPGERLEFLTKAGVGISLLRSIEPAMPIALEAVSATTVAELDNWMHHEALALAELFDARAGTPAKTTLVNQTWAQQPTIQPIDLAVLPITELTEAPSTATAIGVESPYISGDTTTAVGAGITPDTMVSLAEAATDRGDLLTAARLYADAATAFEAHAEPEAAGFALAEAAVLSDRLNDTDSAAVAFARGFALLMAAGTGIEFAGPVARSCARVASTRGEFDDATAALATALERADLEYLAVQADEQSWQAANPDGAAAPELSALGQRLTNLAAERGRLLDTRARVFATQGLLPNAVTDAKEAAEVLAEHGHIGDAAHAFWLAGRLQHTLGDNGDALWLLESAAEGFQIVRDKASRVEVTGELSSVLKSLGRVAEAENLVRELAG